LDNTKIRALLRCIICYQIPLLLGEQYAYIRSVGASHYVMNTRVAGDMCHQIQGL